MPRISIPMNETPRNDHHGLTGATAIVTGAMAAYAERQGVAVETFVQSLGSALTPDQVGKAVPEIAMTGRPDHRAYMLTSAGISPLA